MTEDLTINFKTNAEQTGRSFEGLRTSLLAVGAAAVAAFGAIGKGAIDNAVAFENFEATLTASLGTVEKANAAFDMLSNLASSTPFELKELMGSYQKLVGRGLNPTKDELIALGDVAAASGKPFDQLAEAMLDAVTGENERLKEFGITAKKSGDKVFYTYKGITTEVENTDKAIKDYILSLGELDGVEGMMAKQSNTLGGAISNLKDTFAAVSLAIGKELSPVLQPLIRDFSALMMRSIPAITRGFKELVDIFTNLATSAGPILEGIWRGLTEIYNSVEDLLNSSFGTFLEETFVVLLGKAYDLLQKAAGAIAQLFSGFQKLYESSEPLQGAFKAIGESLGYIMDIASELIATFRVIYGFFTENTFGQGIVNFFVEPFEKAFKIITRILGAFREVASFVNDVLGVAEAATPAGTRTRALPALTTPPAVEEMTTTGGGTQSNTAHNTGPIAPTETLIGNTGPKSITIHIETLIGTQTISQNEDPLVVKRLVERALLTAVADAASSY